MLEKNHTFYFAPRAQSGGETVSAWDASQLMASVLHFYEGLLNAKSHNELISEKLTSYFDQMF